MSDQNKTNNFNPHHKKPIQRWYRDVAIRQQSHSELAEDYDSKERFLTTCAVGLNAIVSSVIFTSVNNNQSSDPDNELALFHTLTILAGVISAINTVLQAITKNLQFAEGAEQHQQAFRQFTQMRFRLENIFGNEYIDDEKIDRSYLNEWINEYRDLLESSPLIPQDIFVKQTEKEDARWKVSSTKIITTAKTNINDSIQINKSYDTDHSSTDRNIVRSEVVNREVKKQYMSDLIKEKDHSNIRAYETLRELAFL